MRAQSAIEFLTTYGFMFIIIGVVLSVLAFISVSPIIYSSSQCSSFAGPSCSYVHIYSNLSGHYSLLTFALTNGESVPINITNLTVIISSKAAAGTCTPLVVLPGQSTVCMVQFPASPTIGAYITGFYQLYASMCNSGVSSTYINTCNYQKANYSGSFQAPAESSLPIVASLLALQGSPNQQLIPYPGVPYPFGTKPVESTTLSLNLTGKVLKYAFGTPGYQGDTYLSQSVSPFPFAVNSLNNNNVDCGTPGKYNSTYSIFATTLYLPTPMVLNVSIVTDNAMEVFYKPSSYSSWLSVFGGGAWKGQGATQYTNNGVRMGAGIYNLEVLWSNICGPGVQVLKISNFTSTI